MTDIRVIIREFSRGTSLREMERKRKLPLHTIWRELLILTEFKNLHVT